jgi:hypothetical protein
VDNKFTLKGFTMDWNTVIQVVIGVIAVAGWMEARSAKRKIQKMKSVYTQYLLDFCEAGRNQVVSIEINRNGIWQLRERVVKLELGHALPVPDIAAKVEQLDNRIQCVTEGHLDPVCPRCHEPLVLAEPAAVADSPDKPRRRARAIRETQPETVAEAINPVAGDVS